MIKIKIHIYILSIVGLIQFGYIVYHLNEYLWDLLDILNWIIYFLFFGGLIIGYLIYGINYFRKNKVKIAFLPAIMSLCFLSIGFLVDEYKREFSKELSNSPTKFSTDDGLQFKTNGYVISEEHEHTYDFYYWGRYKQDGNEILLNMNNFHNSKGIIYNDTLKLIDDNDTFYHKIDTPKVY